MAVIVLVAETRLYPATTDEEQQQQPMAERAKTILRAAQAPRITFVATMTAIKTVPAVAIARVAVVVAAVATVVVAVVPVAAVAVAGTAVQETAGCSGNARPE